jgi:hypothetical protein
MADRRSSVYQNDLLAENPDGSLAFFCAGNNVFCTAHQSMAPSFLYKMGNETVRWVLLPVYGKRLLVLCEHFLYSIVHDSDGYHLLHSLHEGQEQLYQIPLPDFPACFVFTSHWYYADSFRL